MEKPNTSISQATRILSEIARDPMGGWFDLPFKFDVQEMSRLKIVAQKIQSNSKYLVCIGIGGSYLGHRAVIEAVRPKSTTKLLYVGNSLSSRDLKKVVEEIGNDDYSVLVISKSGGTLEPAVAFRVFKKMLIEKYGVEGAKQRIYAITDKANGALHNEAVANGYTYFAFPDNIGGRYSVLSAVGMLPMLVAGVDGMKLLQGARECREKQLAPENYGRSALINYAFLRHKLYSFGAKIEVLASFEPGMMYFNEWWKQLFGESEGKNEGGLFPASVIYTTDLHSMGQYMQEGQRGILETFIKFVAPENYTDRIIIPTIDEALTTDENGENKFLTLDELQVVAGKSMDYTNDVALQATVSAHDRGGITTVTIEMRDDESQELITERSLGFLIYFFEVACAISAKLNGVNPFDQPGVEAYKQEMQRIFRGLPTEEEKKKIINEMKKQQHTPPKPPVAPKPPETPQAPPQAPPQATDQVKITV